MINKTPYITPQYVLHLLEEINTLKKSLDESYDDFGEIFNRNSELLRTVDELKEKIANLEQLLHQAQFHSTIINHSTKEEFIMNEQAEIRYVHCQNVPVNQGIDGYTIAYVRSEDHIFFAWAEKCVADQYIKEIGRVHSSNRLGDIPLEMVNDASENNFSIDFSGMMGVLSIEYFTAGLEAAFSDQHVAAMTMFDFKHAFLSRVMKQIVVNQEV